MELLFVPLSEVWVNLLFIFVINFTLFFFFFFFVHRRPNTTRKFPPSPPRIPIIGNLHQLGTLPHQPLEALARKHGPVMLIHIGYFPTIIISSAEMACEVMKTHDLVFASRPRLSMPKILMYDCDVAFSPYGEYWRQVKKICVIHLLSMKMVQSYSHIRGEEVSLMVSKIRSSQPEPVNLSELIIALTTNIISRTTLGKKYNEEREARKLGDMVTEFTHLIGSFPIGECIPWLSWLDNLSGLNARVRKSSKELDDFLEGVLEEHLLARKDSANNDKEDNDFVDVLLSVNSKDGISLSRDNIKALILDMFAAGTDTTFTTIEWTMAELIRNPKVMKTVQEEVRRVVGCKQNITDKDIDGMIYLKAIIKETLRLHAPIPLLVPRETVKDIELGGFHIPKGTRVMVNAWAIGRDPSSWERPEEFEPDRFIDSNVDFKGQDFQFIPFGSGRRSCPGVGFAILTIELTLANLLHHFDWELPKGMEEKVLNMSEAPGITVHKKSGLVLKSNTFPLGAVEYE